MWGRKEDSDPEPGTTTRSEANPAPAAESKPSPAPRAAAPTRPATTKTASEAQIGKSLKVKGEIAGSEDLFVDGEVEGKITLQGNNLTIGPHGNVRAEVSAHSITILGRLEGNVRAADRVEIRKTGSLEGDLVTARIAIEEDAVFRGSIDIVKPGSAQSDSGSSTDSAAKAKASKAGS